MIVAFANGECTPAASSHLARHRWGSSTRRAEHRPLACAPSGDSPRCCSSEHQRSKTPLAHRLESRCSVNGRFRRGRVKKTAVRSVQFCRRRRRQLHYFISSTERLRLISRVIFRCMCAGMPVIRRGKIFPLSVTNFFSKSGFL